MLFIISSNSSVIPASLGAPDYNTRYSQPFQCSLVELNVKLNTCAQHDLNNMILDNEPVLQVSIIIIPKHINAQ